MKRVFILSIFLVFSMVACSNQPTEPPIDLTELDYYAYLSDDNPLVTIKVSGYGTMKLQLFPSVAENTVNNFIVYIQSGAYDGSSFHRIIEDFMVQGGRLSDTNCPIKGEFPSNGISNPLSHDRGVISMARTNVKDSATSQFFIVHQDSHFLDINYASFGGLISGFNVLDALARVSTNDADAPLSKITIESITVELNGYNLDEVNCAY
ncbi:MAG: peptidylprolyl isomerase [Candidatus Izemoplasmatales bacterium]